MNFARRFACSFCSLYQDLRDYYLFFDSKAKVVSRDDLPPKKTFEHLPTFFVFNIFPIISTSDGQAQGAKGAL